MSLNADCSINFELNNLDLTYFSRPRNPFVSYLENLSAFSSELNDLNREVFTRTDEQFSSSANNVTQCALKLLNEFSIDFAKLRDGEMISGLLQKISCAYSNPVLTFDQKNVLKKIEKVLENNQQNVPEKSRGSLKDIYNNSSLFANDVRTVFNHFCRSSYHAPRKAHTSSPLMTIRVFSPDWSGIN